MRFIPNSTGEESIFTLVYDDGSNVENEGGGLVMFFTLSEAERVADVLMQRHPKTVISILEWKTVLTYNPIEDKITSHDENA